jgi:hypothetical protein
MEDELKRALSDVSSEFVRATGRKPSGVWASAVKDGRFMERLDRGEGFTVKTFDRALRWFSDHWPNNAKWPKHVPRPERAAA